MDKMTSEKIRKMLCREVDEIVQKGELSAGDLDTLHKLTDTIKNVDKIDMLEEGEHSQYSGNGGYGRSGGYGRDSGYGRAEGGYGRADGYDRGSSYTRGRSSTTGRYMSRSSGTQQMTEGLEEIMQDGNLNSRQQDIIRQAMMALGE